MYALPDPLILLLSITFRTTEGGTEGKLDDIFRDLAWQQGAGLKNELENLLLPNVYIMNVQCIIMV